MIIDVCSRSKLIFLPEGHRNLFERYRLRKVGDNDEDPELDAAIAGRDDEEMDAMLDVDGDEPRRGEFELAEDEEGNARLPSPEDIEGFSSNGKKAVAAFRAVVAHAYRAFSCCHSH